MDEIIKIISRADFPTILAMLGMFWLLKCHLDKKFEKIVQGSNEKFDKVDQEFKDNKSNLKDIGKDIQELRTSINRMEGAFYNKDCCMLKDAKLKEKAE